MHYYDWGWRPRVSMAERKLQALRKIEQLRKKGHIVSSVKIEGRAIATTFWGKAWCENLERYSDFANRLPRGRTYARNGSVIDLQIGPGQVKALVSGSSVYRVEVKISPVAKARWKSICKDCAGAIDSLIELLEGRLSEKVMERICRENTGLFPSAKEIDFSCSCPDWAFMCKHIAAVLYGIGARLDRQPELLFRLHKLDENELIRSAGTDLRLATKRTNSATILSSGDLSELFGLDLAQSRAASAKLSASRRDSKKSGKKARGQKLRISRGASISLATLRKNSPSSKPQ
jgi:uncharacterized Zn finger protein